MGTEIAGTEISSRATPHIATAWPRSACRRAGDRRGGAPVTLATEASRFSCARNGFSVGVQAQSTQALCFFRPALFS